MNQLLPGISPSLSETINSLRYIYPELSLSIAFLMAILLDLFVSKRFRHAVFVCTLLAVVAAAYFTFTGLTNLPAQSVFSGMIRPGHLSSCFKLIFYTAGLLFIIFTRFNLQLQSYSKGTGDLYVILLAVLLGMSLMAMSANLLMAYLSVEIVSVGSYLMVGYVSANNRQAEASLKYALFGGVCSAVMLYGMSLVYAITGTLNLFDPAMTTGLQEAPVLSLGLALAMVFAGIGFKVSFVPFHFWSPDVYEGAPTPVTAFLSTGPKLAGIALLIIFLAAFRPLQNATVLNFYPFISAIAIITMIAGNFSALWQDNVKRMLAYSSIGHTGFMLMAVNPAAESAILFYSFAYTLMNMGAFMLADYVEEKTGAISASSYKGLGKQMPLVFVSFVIILVSLTGLPPTAGFFGKLLIFNSVWENYRLTGNNWSLAMMITGALTTVVSLFYYLKIPLNAWLRVSGELESKGENYGFIILLGALLSLVLLVLGLFPGIVF